MARKSSKLFLRILAYAFCIVALCALAGGCATTGGASLDSEERTSLIVVRAGEQVKMTWESQADRSYTVLYSQKRNAAGTQWKPLQGYVNMRGTGKTMRAEDRVPRGQECFYRLRSADL